jgi:GNAT superfamily N-acetyltransferase
MTHDYSFREAAPDELAPLKSEWLGSLTSPQDGMWESFRHGSSNWAITCDGNMIGYAAVNQDNRLLQFYVSRPHAANGDIIFKSFITEKKITSGIVGTNNPVYLSIALNFVQEQKIDTLLFRHTFEATVEEKPGQLMECQADDLEQLVDFYHLSIGAPKEWLSGYVGGLIKGGEIFAFVDADTIVGTCEVRKSASAPKFADIGMVVSPDYRKQGYGTFLLHTAKTIAQEWEKVPICSCEKDNVGSLKSIQKCGFVSRFQLLDVSFK